MVPTGIPSAITIVLLVAMKFDGAVPNVQVSEVPDVSNKLI
jgi:hypothetical protein